MAGLKGPHGPLAAGRSVILLSSLGAAPIVTSSGAGTGNVPPYTPSLNLSDPRNTTLFLAAA
jgi:hypothetical protein